MADYVFVHYIFDEIADGRKLSKLPKVELTTSCPTCGETHNSPRMYYKVGKCDTDAHSIYMCTDCLTEYDSFCEQLRDNKIVVRLFNRPA